MRYAETCLAVWAKEDAALPEVALDLAVQEFLQFGLAVRTNWAFSVGAFECEHCLLLIHADKKETVRLLAMAVCGPCNGLAVSRRQSLSAALPCQAARTS